MEDEETGDVWMEEAVSILVEVSELSQVLLDRKLPKRLEKRVHEVLLRCQEVITYHENTMH